LSFVSSGYSVAVIVHNRPAALKFSATGFSAPCTSLVTNSIANPSGSTNCARCSSGVSLGASAALPSLSWAQTTGATA